MNPQLENGYTKVANEILEKLAKTRLSSYEWQVIMAIFRKTYGFSKKEDWIANSQLCNLTGIHKAHISRTVKKLKDKNIVTQTGNKISFNKYYPELPKQVTLLPNEVTGVTQTGNNSYLNRRTQKKKETITKENIQKRVFDNYGNPYNHRKTGGLSHLSEQLVKKAKELRGK